jgi:hypothetical protein
VIFKAIQNRRRIVWLFSPTTKKRGIEKMLEGELDAHLGYDKHDKSFKTNVMVFIQKK